MIEFQKFKLKNNLTVIVHQDKSTPMACLNIIYDVGARDEDENKTGFAHLFEHLMFGGSVNIPNYDEPLQLVGGENNAFTSPDMTNYYLTLPANNLETAFWLESDRMLSLAFDTKSLEVQRKVVIEEFNQRYLNQPYGDVWLKLRPLAYQVHPYSWATIGKEVQHIEEATMEDVKAFFAKNFPDSIEVIPMLAEDFFKNPTSTLVTMKCFPWAYEDKIALIGDACHAIVPFYGQGMNAGFEDITVLNEMMQLYGNDWKTILSEYQKSRKPNADAIAELSYRNFMEMSTKTADEKFLLQKKIEKVFSDKYPDLWIPLYSRVTFSDRPYAEALAIGDAQNTIMEEVLRMDNIESIWDSVEVENKILELLQDK